MGRRLTDEERELRAVTERELQSRVLDLARMYGWRVAHFHDSRRQVRPGVMVGDRDAAGFPDLVLVRGTELLFVELKRETGRATDLQLEWLEALGAVPGVEALLVRPSSFDELAVRLCRSRR